jgi:hypothetical protein
MTLPTNGSRLANGNGLKETRGADSGIAGDPATDLEAAFSELQSSAPAATRSAAKRGRKPGSAVPSAHERLQKQLAAIEVARAEVRRLEQETAQKTASIVGAALLERAERDEAFRHVLLGHLRDARLTPRERGEIAHLFVKV